MKATLLAAACLACGMFTTACSTAPTSESGRVTLRDNTSDTLDRMYAEDSGLRDFLHNADGYAVFPTVGKGAAGVGGAYGRGEVFENGHFIGYADISQATIGAQLGGQRMTEVVAFETPRALDRFKSGQFAFDANASAVAMKSGAAATARYTNGVAVFVQADAGLMVEASIGGQSFSFQPADRTAANPNGYAGADQNP